MLKKDQPHAEKYLPALLVDGGDLLVAKGG
jgi:hypothetical protein